MGELWERESRWGMTRATAIHSLAVCTDGNPARTQGGGRFLCALRRVFFLVGMASCAG